MIHGNDNHAELIHWFEELWNEAEDFNEALMREMKQSWAASLVRPYDVYMKTLYALVRDRLEDTVPKNIILEDEITLTGFALRVRQLPTEGDPPSALDSPVATTGEPPQRAGSLNS